MGKDIITIVNQYLDHDRYLEFRHLNYEFDKGYITFLKSRHRHEIVIYLIKIHEQFKRQGIFKSIVQEIVKREDIYEIIVCGVSSYILHKFLSEWIINSIRWHNQGGDFIYSKNNHRLLIIEMKKNIKNLENAI